MIVYEVSLTIDPSLVDPEQLHRYMTEKHIPEILAIGCFTHATFEQSGDREFRTRYSALSGDAIDRYLAEHAADYRRDFLEHFPRGIEIVRKLWTEVARW